MVNTRDNQQYEPVLADKDILLVDGDDNLWKFLAPLARYFEAVEQNVAATLTAHGKDQDLSVEDVRKGLGKIFREEGLFNVAHRLDQHTALQPLMRSDKAFADAMKKAFNDGEKAFADAVKAPFEKEGSTALEAIHTMHAAKAAGKRVALFSEGNVNDTFVKLRIMDEVSRAAGLEPMSKALDTIAAPIDYLGSWDTNAPPQKMFSDYNNLATKVLPMPRAPKTDHMNYAALAFAASGEPDTPEGRAKAVQRAAMIGNDPARDDTPARKAGLTSVLVEQYKGSKNLDDLMILKRWGSVALPAEVLWSKFKKKTIGQFDPAEHTVKDFGAVRQMMGLGSKPEDELTLSAGLQRAAER